MAGASALIANVANAKRSFSESQGGHGVIPSESPEGQNSKKRRKTKSKPSPSCMNDTVDSDRDHSGETTGTASTEDSRNAATKSKLKAKINDGRPYYSQGVIKAIKPGGLGQATSILIPEKPLYNTVAVSLPAQVSQSTARRALHANASDRKLLADLFKSLGVQDIDVDRVYRLAGTHAPSKPNDDTTRSQRESHVELDAELPPISDHDAIYDDIVSNLIAAGYDEAFLSLDKRPLRIFTMCSGTESPIIAARLMKAAFERTSNIAFDFFHVASCEIEPLKQAYIYRNFDGQVIYRDVTDFCEENLAARDPLTVYGAPESPPSQIDILIAGSSCVDYSNLNISPKDFQISGESWATMRGICEYSKKYRPTMVILENVRLAPWEAIKAYWETIDYVSHVVYTDTKDHYIPHTRQRGYMLALDKKLADRRGFSFSARLPEFEKVLNTLARRASAPFPSFLVTPDHPEFQLVARDAAASVKANHGRSANWTACQQRMNDYRTNEKLGSGRPVTQWQADGSSRPPDYFANRSWVRSQCLRIKDFLDIIKLRSLAEKHYDPFYKTRCIDLSQNIDREIDNKQPGIIGCITPNGSMFYTLRGGPISGREALNLQGIPVKELSFGIETSRQLTDLAGNAMSGTVVATTLIAAIVVAWTPSSGNLKSLLARPDADRIGTKQQEYQSKKPSPPAHLSPAQMRTRFSEDRMIRAQASLDRQEPRAHLEDIMEMASRSRQLCACETYSELNTGRFFICNDCSHTACGVCLGNPKHSYTQLLLQKRESPSAFVSYIQKHLPRSLKLNPGEFRTFACQLKPFGDKHEFSDDKARRLKNGNDAPEINAEKIKNANKKYQQRVFAAAGATYHYRCVYRSHIWKIEYVSPFGRLELRISPISKKEVMLSDEALSSSAVECEWLVFADCDSEEPSGSDLRRKFQSPIASMVPNYKKGDILNGEWEAYISDPSRTTVTVRYQGTGNLVDSYESRLGLQTPQYKNRKEFDNLKLSIRFPLFNREMDFQLLPECAGAQGSLHICKDNALRRPLYLFLDPDPLSPAYADSYCISFDHHRRNNYERRAFVLRFPPGWRPNVVGGRLEGDEIDCENCMKQFLPHMAMAVTEDERNTDMWVPQNFNAWSMDLSPCLGVEKPLLCVRIPLPAEDGCRVKPQGSFEIDLADRQGKLTSMEWVLKKLEVPGFLGMDARWLGLEKRPVGEGLCACCPPAPNVSWKWTYANGKCKTRIVMPVEDPVQAGKFEKALQRRPSPATAVLRRYANEVFLEVKVNPQTLAHRAAAAVHPAGDDSMSAELEWRIVKYDALEIPPNFEAAPLQSNKAERYAAWQLEPQPADITGRKLWDAQRELLTWALHQESNPPQWMEIEQADATIPPLDWSIEVRAKLENRVRGGIIADEVGAGKTISALALFAADRKNFLAPLDSIRINHTRKRLCSDATLILVPAGIFTQWRKQVNSCFKDATDLVLELKTIDQLKECQLEDLVGAKIILASHDLFDDLKYWAYLRRMTYSPNTPVSGGRAFEHWLKLALGRLGNMLSKYDKDDEGPFWKEREKAKNDLEQFETFTAYRCRKDNKKIFKANQAPLAPNDVNMNISQQYKPRAFEERGTNLDDDFEQEMEAESGGTKIYALLHAFHFRRLMVDEFTYLADTSLRGTVALSASCRWLLSGTPPINNLDGINTMARLLGTKLSNDDIRPEYLGAGIKSCSTVRQRSHVEEFLRYTKAPSVSALKARHTYANDFLRMFVRKNRISIESVKKSEHFIVFRPSALEYATYVEWYKVVRCSQIAYGRKTMPPLSTMINITKPMKRSEFIRKWVEHCLNGPHALTCCTSVMRGENSRTSADFDPGCRSILAYYMDQLGKIVEALILGCCEAFSYDREPLAGAVPSNRSGPAETLVVWATFIRTNLDGDGSGDPSLTALLNSILDYASRHPARAEKLKINQPGEDRIAKEVKLLGAAEHRLRSAKASLAKAKDRFERGGRGRKPILQLEQRVSKAQSRVTEAQMRLADTEESFNPTSRDNSEEKTREKEMKLRTKEMTGQLLELLTMIRVVRFFHAITDIDSGDSTRVCARCHNCENLALMVLLANCGHVLCKQCREDMSADDCPEVGCKALNPTHLQIDCSRFGDQETVPHSVRGSRLDAVITLLKELLQESEDRILIFVQFDTIRDHLAQELLQAGIMHVDATVENAGDIIQDFKSKAPGQSGRRVLILKVDTADAAGWDLQIANRIVFVAPLVAESRHAYESIMTQAIGRVYRFGQKKDVHVYHFAMAKTNEVNILEVMKNESLVRRWQQEDEQWNPSVIPVARSNNAILVQDVLDGDERLSGPSMHDHEVMEDEAGDGLEGGDGDVQGNDD